MDSYNFTDISGTNFSYTKVSNPNNTNEALHYQKQLLKTEKERFLTERKIIKELPIQIEFQVRETLNEELQKMKDELDQYQNNLGLQINNIKGQINRTNEEKSSIEMHIQNLKHQIKKTQQDDIIRQREILNQFVFNQKQSDLYSLNTRKINEGEHDDPHYQQQQQPKFQFPQKPRPYYNLNDPKLESFHLQHNHQPLHNTTSILSVNKMEPSSVAFSNNGQENQNIKSVPRIKHQQYYNGINLDRDLDSNLNINIPEDHKNSQNLKHHVDPHDIDVQNILRKNQNRLEELKEINLETNMAELDAQLFNQVVENERYQ